MKFEAIEREALPGQIATKILNLIKQKRLGPGDKLPPERELAAMMRVSRPSLRSALQALALMNVVEIRQGSGTYVTSLDPELLSEPLEFIFSLDDSTLAQLFQARKILEVGIIALAAERITDEELAELDDCLERFKAHLDDNETRFQYDLEFHDRITRAARNPILARFMSSISQLSLASRRRSANIPGVSTQSARDHEEILAALKKRDADAAKQAMLQHLQNIEQLLNWPTNQNANARAD